MDLDAYKDSGGHLTISFTTSSQDTLPYYIALYQQSFRIYKYNYIWLFFYLLFFFCRISWHKRIWSFYALKLKKWKKNFLQLNVLVYCIMLRNIKYKKELVYTAVLFLFTKLTELTQRMKITLYLNYFKIKVGAAFT